MRVTVQHPERGELVVDVDGEMIGDRAVITSVREVGGSSVEHLFAPMTPQRAELQRALQAHLETNPEPPPQAETLDEQRERERARRRRRGRNDGP